MRSVLAQLLALHAPADDPGRIVTYHSVMDALSRGRGRLRLGGRGALRPEPLASASATRRPRGCGAAWPSRCRWWASFIGRPETPEEAEEASRRELERHARREARKSGVSLRGSLPGSAWESVQIARNVRRPTARRYLDGIVEGFIELHGDRAFADDGAILAGIGVDLGASGDGHRPGEGRELGRPRGPQLRLPPARGLPQVAAPHARGGEVRPADSLLGGHPGRLLRHRGRGARPGQRHRRQPGGHGGPYAFRW